MGTLGSFAKQRREQLGLTQKTVAKMAGTSPEYLSQIEGGKPKLPNAALRRRLAAALGVPHVDLLVAAGELTTEELPVEGAIREPFPPGDPRRELLELLEETPLDERQVYPIMLIVNGYRNQKGKAE